MDSIKQMIADQQFSKIALERPIIQNPWSEKAVAEMRADAEEMGEERFQEEYQKCCDRIAELKFELARTIWAGKHMAYTIFELYDVGVSTPKYEKFKMPETKILKD
jgi:hypothetical protein